MKGLITFIILLLPLCGIAQNQLNIERITADDGLSQNLVFDLLQDNQGFIWFGTKDGLSRYDGYDFKIYKTDPSSEQSLASNYVTLTYQDEDLNFWVETRPGGLHLYDSLMDHFKRLSDLTDLPESFQNVSVWDMYGNSTDGWWAGTGNGLFHISPDLKTITSIPLDPENNLTPRTSSVVPIKESGELFVSTTNYGIFVVDMKTNAVRPAHFLNKHLVDEGIMLIDRTSAGNWVIAENSTLQFISNEGDLISSIRTHEHFSFTSPAINRVIEEDYQTFRIIQDGRVFLLDLQTETLSEFGDFSYANNLLIDRSGVFWIGTAGTGVFRHDPKTLRFNIISKSFFEYLLPGFTRKVESQTDLEILNSDSDIFSVIQEDEDDFWVLTRRLGIYEYNRSTGDMTRHTLSLPPDGGVRYNIYWMDRNDDGDFYFIYGHGIAIYSPGNGIEFVQEMGHLFPDWQGRLGAPVVEAFTVVKKHAGRYWVGSVEYGLTSYNPENGQVDRYQYITDDQNSLTSNFILSLSADPVEPERYIWVGTDGGGLNRIEIETGDVLRFTELDGLPNNVIYAIYPDQSGNLWMSSNKGIIRLNAETFELINFVNSDGLQSNEFNRRQHMKMSDERLLFCGIDGCNLFDPNRIELNQKVPQVAITGVSVMNENILPFGSDWFTFEDEYPVLNIEWNQNIIGFEFASLDFSAPDKNRYRYRFPPFLNDWTEIGSRRDISFTNLDPGDYLLEVQGSNNDGIWSTSSASVSVVVTPPFWMTSWFRILALILFSGLIAGTAVYLSKQKYRRKLREMEYKMMVDQERLRISRDMHDDLGSRLTQISMMSRLAESSPEITNLIKQKFEAISDEAEKVIHNFSEIVWSLNPKNDTLEDLAEFMVQYTENFCRKVQIPCRIEADELFPKIVIPSDARHNMLCVLKEALNNATKYSNCSEISTLITLKDGRFIVNVSDNGSGFNPKEVVRNGQGLRTMEKRMHDISGEWSLETGKNAGTTIIFSYDINSCSDA